MHLQRIMHLSASCVSRPYQFLKPRVWLHEESGKNPIYQYFLVEKIESAMEKIVAAGGKERTEKKEEGKHGLQQLFEDSEGNIHGIYQFLI